MASGRAGTSDVVRATLSSAEYFLIENRHRDPEGDGLVLRVWQQGRVVEQRVQNGDDTFTRFNVDSFIGGVVVGVDQYDWALPGGVDEDGNDLNGGILIWHIDERRIAAGLANGGVNADPERRGVDLEEADSAQDLGFPPDNPFGPVADQGTPFDFYFRDNPVTTITAAGQEIRFYENRFGPTTIPNSDSNEGGPSFITLEDFSAPGPEMTFVYRRAAEAGVSPLLAVPAFQGSDTPPFVEGGFISRLEGASPAFLLYTGEAEEGGAIGTLEAAGPATNVTISDGTVALRPVVTPDGQSFFAEKRTDRPDDPTTLLLRTASGTVPIALFQDASYDVTDLGAPLMTLPRDGQQAFYVIAEVSESPGAVVLEFLEDGSTSVLTLPDQPVLSLASDGTQPILVGSREARVQGSGAHWTYDITPGAAVGQAAFGRDRNGLIGVVPIVGADNLLLLRADQTVERLDVSRYTAFIEGAAGPLSAFPVLVDLDEDGLLDVLTTYGTHLVAFSQDGALVRGFPLALDAPATAQPLIVDDEEGVRTIVVASTNGHVYAYAVGQGGAGVPGFPLAVGATVEATPLVEQQTLYAVSRAGSFRAWRLEHLKTTWWGQLYGNAQHHSYIAQTSDPGAPPVTSTSLIIDAETYNWPNPIRDGQTFLRCMTREDATVRITIIDAAGSLVDDIELELRGETPAEHLWRVQAASGLYYARVTATSRSGESATKLIKMAIVR